jgi:NhaP-type Na+/H+ or K+/H+ antiporter
MASVTVAPEVYGDWNARQPSVLIMIVFWLFLGAGIRSLPLSLQRFLPYTVIVLLVGMGVGYFASVCTDDSTACYPFKVITEKAPYPGISPVMLQLAVLPPLIFSELFHTDIYLFRKVMGQALVLAFPGVLLCSVLVSAFVVYLLPQYFDWNTGMMFGAMLAASDPVAVLAGMKELGADPRLTTIISGESIMNDGCAVVLFTLFYGAAFEGKTFTALGVAKFTVVQTFGAATLGLCFLLGGLLVLKLCRREMPVVVTTVITIPFFCFYTATIVGTSGILSLVPLSLGMRLFSRNFLWGALDEASVISWEVLEYMVNSFTFLLSGVIMVVDLWSSGIDGSDVLDLLYIYLASLAARAITVLLFYPLLKNMGLGFNFADALVTWWAGLRGAVGLTVAMMVHFSAPEGHPLHRTGIRFMFHMGGVYFLTAIINATLSLPLVEYLKLDAKPRARILAMTSIADACHKHVIALAENSDGTQSAVQAKAREISVSCHKLARSVSKNGGATGVGEALLEAGDYEVDLDGERRRMLDICTLRYHAYFEAGMISRSACAALDHVGKEAMFSCDTELDRWSVLGLFCAKLLSFSELPLGLGSLALNVSAEIAWGFEEAQRSVRETLPNSPIVGEMEREGLGASAFLKLLGAERPRALQQMRSQHFAFTARNDVLEKIDDAVADGSLHSEEATALKEMANKLSQRAGRHSP